MGFSPRTAGASRGQKRIAGVTGAVGTQPGSLVVRILAMQIGRTHGDAQRVGVPML